MALHKVKITAPGWDTFHGDFCAIQFTNGVSDEPLTRLTIDRISAILPCQLLDEDENELGQAGAAARMVTLTEVSAPVLEPLKPPTPEEVEAEQEAARALAATAQGTMIYTEDQLKVIADQEGIAGLRSIGTKWHVRGRQINAIIFEILKAQSAFKARRKEIEDEQSLARKEATAAAIEADAERERVISATARNLTQEAIEKAKAAKIEALKQIARDQETAELAAEKAAKAADETPNAIGEGGVAVHVGAVEPVFVDPQDEDAEEVVIDTSKDEEAPK